MKSTFVTLILVLFFNIANAQNWGGGVDYDRLNFGFTFQYLVEEYKILKNENWTEIDPIILNSGGLNSISSPIAVGVGVGFVVNTNLTKNLDIRLTPNLVFNDRKILYGYTSIKPIEKKLQVSLVEFPLGLKLKSDRLKNFRAYTIAGLKYSVDIASKKKNEIIITSELSKNLKNQRNYLSYEAGLGMDLYFEWFKMSPELKVSYSFKDVLKHEGNVFDTPIDKAKLRRFTFSLFFE